MVFGLEGTLKLTSFQPSCCGLPPSTKPGYSNPSNLAWNPSREERNACSDENQKPIPNLSRCLIPRRASGDLWSGAGSIREEGLVGLSWGRGRQTFLPWCFPHCYSWLKGTKPPRKTGLVPFDQPEQSIAPDHSALGSAAPDLGEERCGGIEQKAILPNDLQLY